jgi:hypothetical protein
MTKLTAHLSPDALAAFDAYRAATPFPVEWDYYANDTRAFNLLMAVFNAGREYERNQK